MEVEDVVSKNTLREYVLKTRKNIPNKINKDKIIQNKLLKNGYIINSKNILVYISKYDEIDTYYLIEKLLKLNKNVYAPKVENKVINFYLIDSLKNLKLGKFNIYEPTSNILYQEDLNSCIIVPGLMFDKNNNRLGYGGGYYDKFLTNKNIYKIGICYDIFKVEKLETEKHDIKMDLIITER